MLPGLGWQTFPFNVLIEKLSIRTLLLPGLGWRTFPFKVLFEEPFFGFLLVCDARSNRNSALVLSYRLRDAERVISVLAVAAARVWS